MKTLLFAWLIGCGVGMILFLWWVFMQMMTSKKKSNIREFMMLDKKEVVEVFGSANDESFIRHNNGLGEWVKKDRLKNNMHSSIIDWLISIGMSWNWATNILVIAYFLCYVTFFSIIAIAMYNIFVL